MSIELQLRTSVLVDLTRRTLRGALRTACLPAGLGFSIDHLEVANSAITISQLDDAVEMQVPVDVFIVSDMALFSAANATPQGATTPAGTVTFPVRLEVQTEDEPLPDGSGTRRRVWLRLVPQKPTFGNLQEPLGPLGQAIWDAISGQLPNERTEITRLIDILKVGNLDQVGVATGDDVVSVRFGAGGAVTSQLAPGQDWCMLVSGDAVTAMIRGLIEPNLRGALSIASVDASYHHDGTTPRVEVAVGAMLDLFGAELLGAEIELSSTLSLLSGPSPTLRVAAGWSVNVATAALIPIFGPIAALAMEPIAETIATAIISDAFDVTSFGATATSDTSFILDQRLPPIRLGLATLRYDSLVPDDVGMRLGGAVVLEVVGNTPFKLDVSRFSRPSRIQLCSILAKSGSGDPSHEPLSTANTSVFANARIEGAGRFCRIELRSPGAQWQSHVNAPPDGSIADTGTIDVRMKYGVALSMPGPMSFVLRTPRGVRFVDFGRPPEPRFDAQGKLIVLMDVYIPDCLSVVEREKGRFGLGWRWDKDEFRTRPMEEPDWRGYVQQSGGVIVQLVTLQGLDAGEVVRFRSATHALQATTDAEGRLTLPVLQPLQQVASPALLERVDGRSLAGHVAVETAAFEQVATLHGTLMDGATAQSGGLRIVTRTRQGLMRHTVGARGTLTTAALNPQPLPPGSDPNPVALNPQPLPPGGEDGLAALNPQPLPPVDTGIWTAQQVRRLELPGVQNVTWIPGFAGRQVALADIGEDGHLLLDLSGEKTRVAGIFTGPFGPLHTSRHFAFAAAGDQVMVFNRLEAPIPAPACCAGTHTLASSSDCGDQTEAS